MTSILVLDRDESLHAAMAKAARGLASEVVSCHQTARAATELTDTRFDVLVAGPSCLNAGGIRFLQQAHQNRPDLIIVLLAPKAQTDIAVRDLVRIGASDLVRYPAPVTTLRVAVERAMEMAAATTGPADATSTGRTITITSPTGGCGKTFFATNLAWHLATRTGKRVGLIDLDLQFGEVSTALRLRPKYTIADALASRSGSTSLKESLRDFTVHHPSGIEVLAAPGDPSIADTISAPDVTEVLQAAKSQFHYVIVDTPPALTEPVLAALDLSDALFVMATLDLPSVKNLGVFLNTLERLRIPQEGISLILNKAESDVGLSPGEVQRLFRQSFSGILPYSKEVSRAVNAGRAVLESAPASDIGRSLLSTIHQLLPGELALTGAPASASPRPRRAGPFTRLLARLSPPTPRST